MCDGICIRDDFGYHEQSHIHTKYINLSKSYDMLLVKLK